MQKRKKDMHVSWILDLPGHGSIRCVEAEGQEPTFTMEDKQREKDQDHHDASIRLQWLPRTHKGVVGIVYSEYQQCTLRITHDKQVRVVTWSAYPDLLLHADLCAGYDVLWILGHPGTLRAVPMQCHWALL
jgi:hypothetical protein